MKIGLGSGMLAARGLSVDQLLELAERQNLQGVQFGSPQQIDPDLRAEELRGFAQRALSRGLYLEVGIPSPNPVRWSKQVGHDVRSEEHAAFLRPHIEAVAALGCRHAWAFVGDRNDRFRIDTRWPDQQMATLEVLRRLTPLLRELGVRVAIENHADLTAGELWRFIEVIGPDVAGICLDTGNLVIQLDDPLAATERLAPRVLCIQAQDAVLAFTPRGLSWQARPIGSGILPIADMLDLVHRSQPALNVSIDLQPGLQDIPIYDRSWLKSFMDLKPDSLAAVVRLAAECERRYQEGLMPRPPAVEEVDWNERDMDWLARSAGYLRPIVALMERL